MRLLALFTLVAALFQAGPAQAQGGRSGMSTGAPLTNVDAHRDLSAFGHCYARTHRSAALALIATTPGSREESRVFDRLVGGERYTCMAGGTETNASLIYFRGVIAEGLLKAGQGVPDNLVLAIPTVAEVSDLGGVARCYAAGHSTEIQSLLATNVGSREDSAAVAALWDDFRACMPAGFRVRLNAPWIRFLLAEAALRLPRAAAASMEASR